MIYYLCREQLVPTSLEQIWGYFSDPGNLNELTPPDLRFKIISGAEGGMYEGQLIEYRVEFLPGMRSLWLTEISHVRQGEFFIDVQRMGPYRFWSHEHRFIVCPGGVLMQDKVTYAPPFGFLGDIVNALWIRRRLDEIFDYRARRITGLFGEMS